MSPKAASPLPQVETGQGATATAWERLQVPPAPEFSCRSWRRETWKGRDRPRRNRKSKNKPCPRLARRAGRGRERSAVRPGRARQGSVPPARAGTWHAAPAPLHTHRCQAGQGTGAGPRGMERGLGGGGPGGVRVAAASLRGALGGWLDQCRVGARFKDAQLFLRGVR